MVQLLIVTRQIATVSAIHQFKFEFELQVCILNVKGFIEKISLYSKFEDPQSNGLGLGGELKFSAGLCPHTWALHKTIINVKLQLFSFCFNHSPMQCQHFK